MSINENVELRLKTFQLVDFYNTVIDSQTVHKTLVQIVYKFELLYDTQQSAFSFAHSLCIHTSDLYKV